MRFSAAIEGNLPDIVKAEMGIARRAVSAGLRESGKGLRDDLKAHLRASGHKGLARTWRHKHFKSGRTALDMASMVYVRADEGVRAIMWALEHGEIMRPKRGRFLIIPTGYNKPWGFRKSKQRWLVTPDQMKAMRKWTYTKPTKDGRGIVWFLRVTKETKKLTSGKSFTRAYAGGLRLPGRIHGDVGSGRGRRVNKILKDGAVPMFILMPQVRVEKKLNIAQISNRWGDRMVAAVLREWGQLDGVK